MVLCAKEHCGGKRLDYKTGLLMKKQKSHGVWQMGKTDITRKIFSSVRSPSSA